MAVVPNDLEFAQVAKDNDSPLVEDDVVAEALSLLAPQADPIEEIASKLDITHAMARQVGKAVDRDIAREIWALRHSEGAKRLGRPIGGFFARRRQTLQTPFIRIKKRDDKKQLAQAVTILQAFGFAPGDHVRVTTALVRKVMPVAHEAVADYLFRELGVELEYVEQWYGFNCSEKVQHQFTTELLEAYECTWELGNVSAR